MARIKPQADFMVPDSRGGITSLIDLRFEGGDWPIHLKVPAADADLWTYYLFDECGVRNWGIGGICQMEAAENSGSWTVSAGPSESIEIVWSRKKEGPFEVQARASGDLPQAIAKDFIGTVATRLDKRELKAFPGQRVLYYHGLPWRGELWLDDCTRLGPPSKQFHESFVNGARVIVVDILVQAATDRHARDLIDAKTREIGIFLTAILGGLVQPNQPMQWALTSKLGVGIAPEFDSVQLGYCETNYSAKMPDRGITPPIPLVRVDWSKLCPWLAYAGSSERSVPEETVEFWSLLQSAQDSVWQQFLEAGDQFQAALAALRYGHPTTAVSLFVALCESLKPAGRPKNKKADASVDPCDVVGSLLGEEVAHIMRGLTPHPDGMRDAHLHTAKTYGDELTPRRMFSTYQDPSFSETSGILHAIAQWALIHWLKLRGVYTLKSKVGKSTNGHR